MIVDQARGPSANTGAGRTADWSVELVHAERTRVKICGLTSAEDAAAAVRAGADAVGVVLAESRRRVTLEQAAAVLAAVPPLVARVGVFVDASTEEVREAAERLRLDFVQFSGGEPPEACAAAPRPVFKVMHVGTTFDSSVVGPYRGLVAAILLDTLAKDARGGTGKAFNWQSVHEFPAWVPLFVAGGLTSDTVGTAIHALHPFAVDVSSGVESSPGVKDHAKVRSFVAAVRAADMEVLTDG
jgi:phosphoribosylanthranilate isomerase